MEDTVKWLLGYFLTLVGAMWAYSRHVSQMIKAGDDALHERVNRTRDEYVRRSDYDAHSARIEGQIRDLRQDVKEGQKDINDRLDRIFTQIKER